MFAVFRREVCDVYYFLGRRNRPSNVYVSTSSDFGGVGGVRELPHYVFSSVQRTANSEQRTTNSD